MNPKVSVFLEIFLVGLGLVGLWFFLSWSTVYAEVDRLELEELKKEVGLAEIEFKKINREIVDLKILQRGLEHDLENQKTLLENIKEDSKTDWNAIPKIEQIEKSITNLEIQIEENNEILLELEEERNSFADKALLLQDQYNNDFEQFKIQNTFDPTGYTKLIGIVLSEGCQELIKNDFEHNCPTYRQLSQLDTSNQEFTGYFGVHDGWFNRGPEVYENSHRSYDYDPTLRIIVDPPADQRDRIKMITIENNFQTYFVPDIDNKLHNNTRTYHELRWTEGCRNAQVSVINWTSILPDTIHYLRTGCTVTGFDEMKFENRTDSEWNPEDSPGWHYRNWVEEMKKLCLGLC